MDITLCDDVPCMLPSANHSMLLTPPDLEQMAKRREAEKLAEQEAERAAEERRIKMDELEAKMRAQVEMRAKLEAEAKLKLEKQVTSWCMLQARKSASGDTGGARGRAEPRCVHAHHAPPVSSGMSFDVWHMML